MTEQRYDTVILPNLEPANPPMTMLSCQECGAVVAHMGKDVHDQWHREMGPW